MRGLALSGGGAFGAYQAGVWQVLEEKGWRPDLISGLSIGAVNGFAISRGATAAELRAMWLEWPAEEIASAQRGWVLTRHIPLFRNWLERVCRTFGSRPQVTRLRVVLLEMPSLELRWAEGDEVSMDHLSASCAVPGLLLPVRLKGRRYIDPGPLLRLPLRALIDAGADDILGVDLLHVYPSPPLQHLRRVATALRDFVRKDPTDPTPEEMSGVRFRLIAHPEALGGPRQPFEWTQQRTLELIDKGRQDALAKLEAEEAAVNLRADAARR